MSTTFFSIFTSNFIPFSIPLIPIEIIEIFEVDFYYNIMKFYLSMPMKNFLKQFFEGRRKETGCALHRTLLFKNLWIWG